ncbi:class II aldolase/adducin family protein [Aquabacter sp. P-9]|uniref:class II aldolase/adducin family protein n=1 Tax=Aquabacter sediminis TaxID=3029197 RepID=UPI00237DF328|nr:class II aldolase/adducin family protein [Aquabacter sp. P-9]MDE1567243.1 class II aldolase/adducin family protein [Aquabacter sp. P-9]
MHNVRDDRAITRPSDFHDLLRATVQLGENRLLVQGPGGNTSIKDAGVLWVKASGIWMAQADERNGFVPVDLSLIRDQIRNGHSEPGTGAIRTDLVAGALGRPSIETSFHALLPHRVVLHTHSVSVLAGAIRADAEQLFNEKLRGLNWALIPYARPGLPLTHLIADRMIDGAPNVLVLRNHGLVVGGGSVDEALGTMAEVERRLEQETLEHALPDLDELAHLAHHTDWVLPADASVHRLGVEPQAFAVATRYSLYPDHVVFLGSRIAGCREGEALPPDAPLVAVEGKGVLVRQSMSAASLAMIGCLSDVLARLTMGATVEGLSTAQENELLNWDAEKLRQSLNRP